MCISDVCLDCGTCISAVAAASPGAVEDNTIDLKQHGKVYINNGFYNDNDGELDKFQKEFT